MPRENFLNHEKENKTEDTNFIIPASGYVSFIKKTLENNNNTNTIKFIANSVSHKKHIERILEKNYPDKYKSINVEITPNIQKKYIR